MLNVHAIDMLYADDQRDGTHDPFWGLMTPSGSLIVKLQILRC